MDQGTNLPAVVGQGAIGTAAVAVAAQAEAEVKAAYTMALARPRNEEDARVDILRACKRAKFAAKAMYRKPVDTRKGLIIPGLSIRFAELALTCWRNARTVQVILHDDDEKRVIRAGVCDLERNVTFQEDVILSKMVERRYPDKTRDIVAQRVTSRGETVYIVQATEDEMRLKQASAASRAIRNCALRLLPADVKEEAQEMIEATCLAEVAADPDAARKKLVDAFAEWGIQPSDIERWLGHSLAQIAVAETEALRGIWQAIDDGETTWAMVMDAKAGAQETEARQPQRAMVDIEKLRAEALKAQNLKAAVAKDLGGQRQGTETPGQPPVPPEPAGPQPKSEAPGYVPPPVVANMPAPEEPVGRQDPERGTGLFREPPEPAAPQAPVGSQAVGVATQPPPASEGPAEESKVSLQELDRLLGECTVLGLGRGEKRAILALARRGLLTEPNMQGVRAYLAETPPEIVKQLRMWGDVTYTRIVTALQGVGVVPPEPGKEPGPATGEATPPREAGTDDNLKVELLENPQPREGTNWSLVAQVTDEETKEVFKVWRHAKRWKDQTNAFHCSCCGQDDSKNCLHQDVVRARLS